MGDRKVELCFHCSLLLSSSLSYLLARCGSRGGYCNLAVPSGGRRSNPDITKCHLYCHHHEQACGHIVQGKEVEGVARGVIIKMHC